MKSLCKTLLVCPTLNPGESFRRWHLLIKKQSMQPALVCVLDSSSVDDTVAIAGEFNCDVQLIHRADFNHGATRNIPLKNDDGYAFIVYLTQDAFLSDNDALENILQPFVDDEVVAVCGRQLPRKEASPIEAHARIFNYGGKSFTRSIVDVQSYGLKTAFISNSFAAYRVSALKEMGGFPDNVIFGEDMYVATKMLKSGYKIAYAADACVYHSHDYTLFQEFRRYFDMGVFHAREPWIIQELGGAEGEGMKFVVSEFKYLLKYAFWQIPEALLRTACRYSGFRLGLMEEKLSLRLKRRFAMNKGYFK